MVKWVLDLICSPERASKLCRSGRHPEVIPNAQVQNELGRNPATLPVGTILADKLLRELNGAAVNGLVHHVGECLGYAEAVPALNDRASK